MSVVAWRRGDVEESLGYAWRWYNGRLGDISIELSHSGDFDSWLLTLEIDGEGGTDVTIAMPGGDLPDAEAQRLAVPTLVAALKVVVERLESGD